LAVNQWTQKGLKVIIDGCVTWSRHLAISDVVWVTGVGMTHEGQQ
jgi:UDP-3-O-[3-hydroxymyristoyl] glucosamine N-acyltransferase